MEIERARSGQPDKSPVPQLGDIGVLPKIVGDQGLEERVRAEMKQILGK